MELERILREMGFEDVGPDVALEPERTTAALERFQERLSQAAGPEELDRMARDLAEFLTWYASRAPDGSTASALARCAADLFASDLKDDESARAARAIAGIRGLDPEVLSAIHSARIGLDDEGSRRLLEALARVAPEPDRERYAAELEALRPRATPQARPAEDPLDRVEAILAQEPEEALKALERHLEKAATERRALKLIARALVATGRGKKVGGWYARALEALRPHQEDADRAATEAARAQRIALLCDLGRAQMELLGNPDGACGAFLSVLDDDPANPEALAGLCAACEAAGDPARALPALERARPLVAGGPLESSVLPHLARAYAKLGRIEEAERVWRRLRAVDPRNLEALRFYEDYHENAKDYSKLFTTLQFALSVVEDPAEKIRINRKMADVAEHRLNNLERALEAHKRILALDPADEEAQAAVVALFEKTRKWHALIEFYNERLRRLPPEAVEERVANLFKIIEIYQDPEKLPSEDNVLATYARIAEISPTNRQALETLARGYESRERWPDLLRVLQKQVALEQDPVVLLDLFHRIAEIALTRMSNEAQAIPFLERILELDPQNLDVVKRLKDIYQRKHNQERLFAMHLRELEMLEGPEREGVLASAAAMARDRLLRYDEALRLYEELYRLNPASREARENLHVLYARLERWADYVKFLKEEVTRPMPEKRRTELKHRLGEILLDRLGDIAAARAVYQELADQDPSDDLAARRLEHILLEQDDLDSLRTLFAKRGDLRAFVAVLAQRDAREKDPSRRVAINLAMAQACEEDLHDPVRAMRYLETAWSLDRTLVDVGRKLVGLYEAAGNVEGAVAILGDLTPALDEPVERLEACQRLHAHLERLGRSDRALAAISEAVRLALSLGQDPTSFLESARATATAGSLWHEYANLLQEAASATMDPDRRREYLLELGDVLENRLLFHDEARAVLEEVLGLDPGNLEALGLLEHIALQLEDYAGLEQVLRRRKDVVADPEAARDIQMRLGRLYEDLMGDDAAAAECYMEVLQSHPQDREVLGGLHRTYERSERFAELADVIRMEIAAADSSFEITRLRCELARVYWEHLEDPDEAIRLLVAVLSEPDADHSDALNQLQSLFRRGLARDAAANVLAPYYRASGRFDDLEALLRERAKDMQRPEARAAIFMELADIHGRIRGDAKTAFDLVVQAVMEAPSEAAVGRLMELAAQTDGWNEVALALGRWVGILPEGAPSFATTLPDAAREAALAMRLGRVYAEHLNRPDLAIRAYEKAWPFQEDDEALLRVMLGLYRDLGDTNSLLMTYDRLAGAMHGRDAQRQVLLEKAEVAQEVGQTDQAVEALERVLDTRPDDREAFARLEGVLEEAGRLEDLVRLLQRQEQVADPSWRGDLLLRIATILRDRLSDPFGAAEHLRRCLTEFPAHEDARLAAEAMILDAGAPGAPAELAECARVLIPVVEPLLRERPGEPDRLVALLLAKAGLAQSAWEKALAFSDVATIERARGAEARAFDALWNALSAMPEDQGLLERVIEAANGAGLTRALADRLCELAPSLGLEARIRMLWSAARLVREDGDLPRASALYEELLELNPGALPILRELDSLLHEMGREAERIPLLSEMASVARSVEEKREIQLRIGVLCEETGDLEGAVKALRHALERRPVEESFDPIAQEAAERLLALYERLGRTKPLVDLRLLMGRVAQDPEVARGHLLLAGILTQEELKSPAEALSIFDEILRANPMDPEVLERAKALAREASNFARLQELIEMELKAARDDSERAEATLALAEVLEAQRDPAFLSRLEEVLAIVPAHPDALSRVRAYLDDETLAVQAARILQDVGRRTGDREVLAEALRVLAARTEDPAEAIAISLQLAECLRELGRAEECFEVLRAAHRNDPAHEAVFEALVGFLKGTGRVADLAGITLQAVDATTPARQDLYLRAANVLLGEGCASEAAEVLERANAEDPVHRPTLDLLARVYEVLSRSDRLVDTLLAIADQADESERVALWIRCGQISETDLHDDERARACYSKVLERFPLHEEAIARLGSLLQRIGDREGYRALCEHELSALADRESPGDQVRRAALLRTLAVMDLEDEQFEQAVAHTIRLLRIPQPAVEDLDVARRVYAETGFRADVFREVEAALNRVVDREGLLDLYRLAANMDLPDPARPDALERVIALEETLGLDPTDDLAELVRLRPADAALRDRFVQAARNSGRLADCVSHLERLFAEHPDEEMTADLAHTVASLLRDDLKREEEAVDYLRVATLRRPGDRKTVEALADLYERLFRYADLALLYENLGDLAEDPQERLAQYYRSYEVVRNRMKDPHGAAEILKKILEQDPHSRTALDALDAIAREVSDPALLAYALAQKAEAIASPQERNRCLLELAGVQESALGDVEAAIRTLKEVRTADPDNEEAFLRLEGLYVRTERYADLADLYETQAEIATALEKKMELLKRAAALHESRLADRETAIALLERILDLEPTNPYAATRLQDLLQTAGDYSRLVALYERLLEHEPSPAAQAGLSMRIAALYEGPLADPNQAIEHARAALSVDPYHEEARAALERFLAHEELGLDAALALEAAYEATGEPRKLCEVLRFQIERVHSAGEREALWLRIAEIQNERVSDKVAAFDALAAALSENPGNEDTLERLHAIAIETAEYSRLYDVLRRLAGEASDPGVRSRLHRLAAEIADHDLKDVAGAAEHYAAYLEDNPGDAETLAVLDRLYSDLGWAERLAEVLRQRIGLIRDESQALDLRMRLGEVLASRLNERAGAVEQYRQVLARRPQDREAIRRLSNLVEDPVAGRAAVETLVSCLRAIGDDQGLAWALDRMIERLGEDEDPLPLHEEAAEVARRVGDDTSEIAHLSRALVLAPSAPDLLDRFVEAVERSGRYAEGSEALAEAARVASWEDLEKTLRLHAGRMAHRVKGREREVEAHLKRVLEIEPLCREAISILEGLYEAEGRAADLVDILARKLKLDMSPAERRDTLRRVAELHRMRREPDLAARCLEEAASLDPTDTGILKDLVALYEKQENAQGLVSTLTRLAQATPDAMERRLSLLRAAELSAGTLQDASGARGILETLLALEPRDRDAQRRLQQIYEQMQDWRSLLQMLSEIVSDDGVDTAERIEAAMKAASVLETSQQDLVAARAMLQRASELDPHFLPVLDELIRLSYRAEDWPGLLQALRRKAGLVSAIGERVGLLVKACEIARVQLADPELTAALAREILALDPANPNALLVTARLMERKGETAEALDLYRRLSKTTGDIEERVEALLGVARILMVRGETGDEVREALRTAARFKPDHPEVNTLLRRLYLDNREFQSVIEVMQRDLKRARGDAERAAICMDIAEIYLNELNDGAMFLRWAEEAHRYKRDDPRIVEGIVNFHLKSGDAARAVPLLEWLVNYLEGKRRLKELPPYAHELGRIFETRGETEKAIQYYRMCQEHDAQNVPNALALGRLYLAREEYEKALRVYQPLIVRLDALGASVRVEVLLSLARIHAARGDKTKARQYVMRVLAEEPENADAQALLAKGL